MGDVAVSASVSLPGSSLLSTIDSIGVSSSNVASADGEPAVARLRINTQTAVASKGVSWQASLLAEFSANAGAHNNGVLGLPELWCVMSLMRSLNAQ
jgi:hypothetical protein